MDDRRGLEGELTRLREWERELPPRPGKLEEPKKKKAVPKKGAPGQIGKPTPSATGAFEPDEEPASGATTRTMGAPARAPAKASTRK